MAWFKVLKNGKYFQVKKKKRNSTIAIAINSIFHRDKSLEKKSEVQNGALGIAHMVKTDMAFVTESQICNESYICMYLFIF